MGGRGRKERKRGREEVGGGGRWGGGDGGKGEDGKEEGEDGEEGRGAREGSYRYRQISVGIYRIIGISIKSHIGASLPGYEANEAMCSSPPSMLQWSHCPCNPDSL